MDFFCVCGDVVIDANFFFSLMFSYFEHGLISFSLSEFSLSLVFLLFFFSAYFFVSRLARDRLKEEEEESEEKISLLQFVNAELNIIFLAFSDELIFHSNAFRLFFR